MPMKVFCCFKDPIDSGSTSSENDTPNKLSATSKGPAAIQSKPQLTESVGRHVQTEKQDSLPRVSPELKDPWQNRKDLWDEAYDALKTNQPEVFKKYKQLILGDKYDLDSAQSLEIDKLGSDERERYLANQIEKKISAIKKEEWTTAAKVYQKTVKTVLFAKDFISSVASQEPHAALAWAGVSTLLPLLLKPDSQRQAATEGIARISDLMLHYRVVEKTFRSRSKDVSVHSDSDKLDLVKNTQDQIVSLYSQILEFQIRLVSYYFRRGFTRYTRDIVTADDWKAMKTNIDASHEGILGKLEVIGDFHLDQALETQTTELRAFVEQAIPLLKSLQSGLATFVASEAQRAILEHLAPDMEAVNLNKEGFEPNHWHRSSGEWMKTSKEYLTWRDSTATLLWCTGVAGSGKTILANIICDDLNDFYREDGDKQVIKIFFDYVHKRPRQQYLAGLWKQLAARRPFQDKELTTLDKIYVKQGARPNEDRWKEMLSGEVRRYTKVFIIIDALDEAQLDNPLQFMEELTDVLPTANVLITTRPEFNIHDTNIKSKITPLEIKAHKKDLLEYVKRRVSRSKTLPDLIRKKPQLDVSIKDQVLENAKGMFQLAVLLMDDLEDSSKPKEVQDKLDNPPDNLDKAYDLSFSRIESQSGKAPKYGKEVLFTLCVAKTSITFEQLLAVLSLELDSSSLTQDDYIFDSLVTGSCVGLVSLDQETRIVRFGHVTTREYLFKFHSDQIVHARWLLLKKSLIYLRLPNVQLEYWSENSHIQELLRVHPFLEYAAVYWGDHVRDLSDHARESGTEEDEDVVSDIMDLLSKDESLACATRVLLYKTSRDWISRHQWGGWGAEQKTKGKMRGINLIAYCGLDSILDRILQDSPEGYLRSSDPFGNVVHWAARGNFEPVLNRLMAQPGISRIINSYSELAHTPLHIALVFSRTRALEILLEHGADPTIKVQREPDWHTLQLAIWHGPPKHVDILLKTGKLEALLWTRDVLRRLALNAAAESEDPQALGKLLPLYAEAVEGKHHVEELVDFMGRNPLHQAAQSGQSRATEIILNHPLGQNLARGKNYRAQTPFQVAAFTGRLKVVKVYIKHIDREQLLAQSEALDYAALRGHAEVLHELLDFFSGSQDAQNLFRRTLIRTVDNGRLKSLEDVVSRIDLEPNDPILAQAILMAASRGHVEVVRYLLKKGVKITLQDQEGSTLLHLGASKRMTSVIRTLLEEKSPPTLDIQDKKGNTPLSCALQSRDATSIKLLLDVGATMPQLNDESQRWLNTQTWWPRYSLPPEQFNVPKKKTIKEYGDDWFSPSSAHDVFRTAHYLKKLLGRGQETMPIVNWILELAEYWIATATQRDGEHWFDENDPNPVYLRSVPITGRSTRPVRRITFHISSHDQSTGPGPGDFDGYTWWNVERESAGQRVGRRKILKNKHRRGEWTDFNVSWPNRKGFDQTPYDPPGKVKETWMSRLGPGDRVLIISKAQLQMWRNYVRRAEVTVYTTCLRKVVYRSLVRGFDEGPVLGFLSMSGGFE